MTALNYNLVAPSQLAELGKLMNYSGDFAILSATTTSIFQNQVIAGLKKLLASDSKYSKMHLVKIAYGSDASAPSVTATNALLTEFPHLKAITSPTTVGIAAAAQAIESAHKGGKIILTGLGEPIEMKKYILDGTVKEYQLWNVANMGVVSAYVLGQSLNGVTFPPGKKFQVPGSGLGTLKVSSDGDIYCQPGMTTFNKANVTSTTSDEGSRAAPRGRAARPIGASRGPERAGSRRGVRRGGIGYRLGADRREEQR